MSDDFLSKPLSFGAPQSSGMYLVRRLKNSITQHSTKHRGAPSVNRNRRKSPTAAFVAVFELRYSVPANATRVYFSRRSIQTARTVRTRFLTDWFLSYDWCVHWWRWWTVQWNECNETCKPNRKTASNTVRIVECISIDCDENDSWKFIHINLFIHRLLNHVMKQGAATANTFGTIAVMYSAFGVLLQYARGEDDEINTIAAGGATGLLYKSTAGLRKCAIGGGIGLALTSMYVLWSVAGGGSKKLSDLKSQFL